MENEHLKIGPVHGSPSCKIFAATAAAEPREKVSPEKIYILPEGYDLSFFEEILFPITPDREMLKSTRIIRENNQLKFARISRHDLCWLVEFHHFIELSYHQVDFKVPDLARELRMSVRTLYRKLDNITELTPNSYLREFRLLTARQMLGSMEFSFIKEVAYGVGFRKPSYFSRVFQERFGLNPKDIIDEVSR